MSKHTPGPWIMTRRGEHYHDIHGRRWEELARVVTKTDGAIKDSAEGMANAKLIAAAPELLEALKHLEGFLSNKGYSEHDPLVRGMARQAIAKAEGI